MKLERIKSIVNDGYENWQQLLLEEVAKDRHAIQHVLTMLAAEREETSQLTTDLNAQLSRAHVALENPAINKDGFVQKEIRKFYKEGRISHCYNMDEV